MKEPLRIIHARIDFYLVLLVVAYVASRAFALANGVEIDTAGRYQWQLLDPELLKSRLLESLVYLHSQPPLFNLIQGVLLKIAATPQAHHVLWMILQWTIGLSILASLYCALRMLSVSRRLSAIATGVIVFSPAAIAYENFLSYTYLDAALMSAALYCLVRAVKRKSASSMVAFILLLAALCMTRSAYHLIWLVVVAGMLVWQLRSSDKRISRATAWSAVAAILLVGAWYAKNWVLFDVGGPSSWMGMNFATMTHTNLPAAERERLVSAGTASPLTRTSPFLALETYPSSLLSRQETGIPALDQETRFDGSANFNHRDYINVSGQFRHEALVVVSEAPSEYLKSVARNFVTFLFRGAADYGQVSENVARIRTWDALYSVAALGQVGSISRLWDSVPQANSPTLKHLPLGEVILLKAKDACLILAAVVILVPSLALQKLRSERLPEQRAVLSFFLVTFAYVLLSGMLLNFGEVQRMRFEIEPLLAVIGGWLASQAWPLRRSS